MLRKNVLQFFLIVYVVSMSSSLVFINDEQVAKLLEWEATADAVEESMKAVSSGRVFQNPRTFTPLMNSSNLLLSMPGHVLTNNANILATKLVTAFPDNERGTPSLPSILSNIFLFNSQTGELKAVSVVLFIYLRFIF